MNKFSSSLLLSIFCYFCGLCFSTITIAANDSKGQFLGAKDTEYPAWFKESFLDLKEDITEATANGKRLMLFFYQDGCPYCNALVERNLSQKDIETKMKKNLDVIAINMWGDRDVTNIDGKQYTEKAFAEALKVQFTPTILFYDEQGNIILRLNGYRAPQRFNVDLDYVVLKNEGKTSYRDYVRQNIGQHTQSVTTSNQLIHEDYFSQPPFDFALKSKNSSRPFAVFFEQKDCPNCEQFHQQVLPDKTLLATLQQFDIAQLDMWSNTPVVTPDGRNISAREWAQELDIRYAPSIVIFNPRGREVIRLEAFFKVFHTLGIFNYVLSEAYLTQPSFQRYLSEFAEHLREQGQDVNIWQFSNETNSD